VSLISYTAYWYLAASSHAHRVRLVDDERYLGAVAVLVGD
jgi:hypothetical protein